MTAVHDTDRHRATLNFYGSARTGQRLDYRAVRAAAAGRWPALLVALGIADEYLRDRHGPCPGCGGTDRFRYDDRDGAGSWLCSAGGGAPLAGDGFNLLASTDEWMSPIYADIGPDGAVWVIDFYSFVIQHNPTPSPQSAGIRLTRASSVVIEHSPASG